MLQAQWLDQCNTGGGKMAKRGQNHSDESANATAPFMQDYLCNSIDEMSVSDTPVQRRKSQEYGASEK